MWRRWKRDRRCRACPGHPTRSRRASACSLVVRRPRERPVICGSIPFATGNAAMRLRVGIVEHEFGRRTAHRCKLLERSAPDTLTRPAEPAVVERLAWAPAKRRIDPSAHRSSTHGQSWNSLGDRPLAAHRAACLAAAASAVTSMPWSARTAPPSHAPYRDRECHRSVSLQRVHESRPRVSVSLLRRCGLIPDSLLGVLY